MAAILLSAALVGCQAGAAPTPQIIYITAAPQPSIAQPTPIVIYVTPAPTSSVAAASASASAATHELTGLILLPAVKGFNTTVTTAGTTCHSIGGYTDIAPGGEVTVRNGAGTVIAVGRIGEPAFIQAQCAYAFTVPAVPDEAFYSIEVVHRAPLTYSRADLEAMGWQLSLELG